MPVRLQSGATANKFRCATRSPYFMIPKPASRLSSRATSTLIAGSSMFAVTRCSVQRQFKPFSIKSRDILAMALASVACARLKQSSDLVFILLAMFSAIVLPVQVQVNQAYPRCLKLESTRQHFFHPFDDLGRLDHDLFGDFFQIFTAQGFDVPAALFGVGQ